MKKTIFLFLMLMLTNFAIAQKSDTGTWFAYQGNHKISKNLNWQNEVQYRDYGFVGDLQQLLIRTGIGYNLTENNNNVLLGYAYVTTENYKPNSDDKITINEHRIYQQFITKQNFGRIFLQHRYRVEERFIADDFKLRFRYALSANIPINSKTMTDKTFYIAFSDEVFLNAKKPTFDRNRLYAGMGYVINKNFRIETGFMAQALESSNRNQFLITIFNSLPFINK